LEERRKNYVLKWDEGRKKPTSNWKRVCMYLSKTFDVVVWNP
jgi:hypothetical protein